jgi:hypothetical protein
MDQFAWLRDVFGTEFTKNLPNYPRFVEFSQRRHLYVHNDGRVSVKYLEVCKRLGAFRDDEPRLGSHRLCTVDVVQHAAEVFSEIGCKLAWVLWRREFPETRYEADRWLLNKAVDWVAETRFDLVIEVLGFVIHHLPPTHRPADDIYEYMVLNLAQAYKWKGNEDMCARTVQLLDWVHRPAMCRLAVAVLRESDQVIQFWLGNEDCILEFDNNPSGLKTWPIFQAVRDKDYFREYTQLREARHAELKQRGKEQAQQDVPD